MPSSRSICAITAPWHYDLWSSGRRETAESGSEILDDDAVGALIARCAHFSWSDVRLLCCIDSQSLRAPAIAWDVSKWWREGNSGPAASSG